ncbi:Tyr recombinase domain-containing protein, partial [Dysosmobacter welbionis]
VRQDLRQGRRRGRYFPVPGLLHGAGLHAWRGEHRRCIGGHRHRR